MKYDFDHEAQRYGSYSLKWDLPQFFIHNTPNMRFDKDTIRVNLADMDFKCAPAIVKAMHRVADFENYGYTAYFADPEYIKSIISWYKRRYGLEIKPEWLVYCNGAIDGVEQTVRAFSEPGDGVILCRPIYRNFTMSIQALGRKIANCQMLNNGDGDYQFDWDSLEEVCAKPENKVFVLCSPQNPVGKVWTRDELVRVADICRRNNVVIVSDEIHCDILRKGVKHIPVIEAVPDCSNIILVSGVNKSFNLMGLHCAYCIIPDEKLRARFCKDYNPNQPTQFAIAGTVAAYNESEDWLAELNEYIDGAMEAAVALFKAEMPKVKVYVPQGSYALWLDFSAYGYTPEVIQDLIFQKANVAMQKGPAHDPDNGGQFMRMCITCPKAKIEEAVHRVAKAFADYEKANA